MEKISFKEFTKIMTEKAYEHDVPYACDFELTPLCNLDCKMCYVHLQNASVKEKMLSGEQWVSLIQGAVDEGMMNALLTGGEAMTHPDFWDIYMFLIDHGVSVQVKTNGILLTQENIERFKEYPPFRIDVSLYGCNSESYIAVTGSDVYRTVSDNIRNAIDAGLNIRLMITPSTYLSPWLEETMRLAKTFDVSVKVNSVLFEPNENTGRHKDNFDIAAEDYIKIFEKEREIFLPEYSREEREVYGRSDRPHVASKGLHCNGGRTGFAINWDGIMVPCLAFPRSVLFSDAVQNGFKKAWTEINSGIKNYEVPQKCHSCEYNEKCHYCPVAHRKMAAENMCDISECEYTKKMLDLTAERQKQ